MTKREFLERLEYELGNMDAGSKSEILNDFREHFDVAEKSGKSEDEVCMILGSPREIASEFIQCYTGQVESPKRIDTGSLPSFIDQLDPRMGINSIIFELNSSDIEICGEHTDLIQLDLNGGNRRKFTTTVTPDGVYNVREISSAKASLSLTLPSDTGLSIDVRTRSGDGEITDIKAKRVSIKSASGDFNLESVKSSGPFTISTASGDICLSSCAAYEGFSISTGSGDIESEDGTGSFKASTGSGDISAVEHNGAVWASTGSGDIEVGTDEIAGTVNYSTGSGEISVECRRLNGNIRMSSGSGDIYFEAYDVNGDISAKTASGDIEAALGANSDMKFVLKKSPGSKIQNDHKNHENARHMVRLETYSGDIAVSVLE